MPKNTGRVQSDVEFSHDVAKAVIRAGYKIVGDVRSPSFIVAITSDQYVGLVCTRLSGIISKNTVDTIFKVNKRRLLKVALVHPQPMSKKYEERAAKSFGVDSVALAQLEEYLDDWKEIVENTSDAPESVPPPKPKPRRKHTTTPAMRTKANADAIITIVQSLAAQIELEARSAQV